MGSIEERPLVSVVIPAYNREKFLGSCIDSALEQDYAPIEVIVVDDGSTDGTSGLCASYGERIRYLRKPNGGAASALNLGIREMRGTWFKWLSSDDELESGALSALMAGMKGRGTEVVYGDFVKIDSRGRTIGRYRDRDFGSQDEFILGLWWHFAGCADAAMIRRSCFERVGRFDEGLRYGEDYDWWLRAALLHGVRFEHVPVMVARYRIHPGQGTREKLESAAELRARIRQNVKRLLEEQARRDPRIGLYYVSATERYRKAFGLVARTSELVSKVPLSSKAQYWGEKLLPRWSSMVYWAKNPPLNSGSLQ